ncbi:MAG TPA: hypothetical protein PLW13_16050, partial [Pseudomonadales bacterium]|nr:hypothetical protein [Pseudomonadales bacterium]
MLVLVLGARARLHAVGVAGGCAALEGQLGAVDTGDELVGSAHAGWEAGGNHGGSELLLDGEVDDVGAGSPRFGEVGEAQ